MPKKRIYSERDLAALAKRFRLESGMGKAQIARMLRVSRPSVQQAEESPEQSLTKLRVRIIEACSPFKVSGPTFSLVREKR